MYKVTSTTNKQTPDFLIGSLIESEETVWALARRYGGIGAHSLDGTIYIQITPHFGKYHYTHYSRTASPYNGWKLDSQHFTN